MAYVLFHCVYIKITRGAKMVVGGWEFQDQNGSAWGRLL